jgi:cysteine synthase A
MSSALAPIVNGLLELVGNTPLVRVRCAESEGSAAVWAKCEQLNPGGSVKDRICLAMIEAAERDGRIGQGSIIVEPTSGNTGIGLAIVCAVKGYKLVLTMPESMSLERRALLEAYGVEIVLTPAEQVMEGAIEAAQEIVDKRGAFMPMQFDNPANPEAHFAGTAVEILEAMGDDTVDAFVAAVGTGGTISGTGKRLKQHNQATRVIAVEPESSPVLSGGEPGPTKIQGIGAGFVPDNFDPSVADEIRFVSDRDAYEMKRRLARESGLLVGISAGANAFVASQVARELGAGKHVVTVLCDTGERYFSLDEYF